MCRRSYEFSRYTTSVNSGTFFLPFQEMYSRIETRTSHTHNFNSRFVLHRTPCHRETTAVDIDTSPSTTRETGCVKDDTEMCCHKAMEGSLKEPKYTINIEVIRGPSISSAKSYTHEMRSRVANAALLRPTLSPQQAERIERTCLLRSRKLEHRTLRRAIYNSRWRTCNGTTLADAFVCRRVLETREIETEMERGGAPMKSSQTETLEEDETAPIQTPENDIETKKEAMPKINTTETETIVRTAEKLM